MAIIEVIPMDACKDQISLMISLKMPNIVKLMRRVTNPVDRLQNIDKVKLTIHGTLTSHGPRHWSRSDLRPGRERSC